MFTLFSTKARKVTGAVISVPSYFNDFQRTIIRNAAKSSGFLVVRTIYNPISATIANLSDEYRKNHKYLIVLDIEESNMEIALINTDVLVFDLLNSTQDEVGGKNFDERMIWKFLSDFQKSTGKDASNDKLR